MPNSNPWVISEVSGQIGFITLNRPAALNALSLCMVRELTRCLLDWRDDAQVQAVALRGSTRSESFGAFCAGGDIRFFHQSLLCGDPAVEDFFTEEYTLNHLLHHYPKPTIAFMDGVVMGGGMGISQGASHRLVTPRTKMAMPETAIGLFPDVGGGYFLSRCPGHTGEWLALTGTTLTAAQACALGLADHCVAAEQQMPIWLALARLERVTRAAIDALIASYSIATDAFCTIVRAQIDHHFSNPDVGTIVQALESDRSAWASSTAALMRAELASRFSRHT